MTSRWLRLDPAFRSSRVWLIVGPISMSVLLGLVTFQVAAAARLEGVDPGSRRLSSFTTWACLLWSAVVPFFFTPGARQRGSRLAMTLPVASRTIWVTHLAAVVFYGAAILVIAAGFVVLNGSLLVFLSRGRNIFQPDVVRLAVTLGTALVLVTVLLQSREPSLHTIPLSKRHFYLTAATLLGVLGIIIALGTLPLPYVLLPVGVAVGLGWRTYRSLPAGFTLVSHEAEDEPAKGGYGELPRPTRGLAFSWFLQRIVWRSLYGSRLQYGWVVAPFVLFLGAALAGATWLGDSSLYYMRFTLIPVTVYMMLVFVGRPFSNLYRLDHLPISRRWLFAVTVLPSLVVLSVGYGVGKIGDALSPPRELVSYRMDPDSHYYVYVPVRADSIAWNGQPPLTSSPWGETHEAWSAPLCRKCRPVIYSPFHTPIGSSLDFVALQITRASQSLYGESPSPEEIKNRYLAVDEEGNVVARGEGLTLRADFPHLRPRGCGPLFPVILTLIGLPWAFFVHIFLRSFRATISDGKRRTLLLGLLFLLLGVHFAQYALLLSGVTRDWILTGTVEILVRHMSESVPGGALLTWLGCVLLLYGGYRFAESEFLRIEAPPIPAKMNPIDAWFSS